MIQINGHIKKTVPPRAPVMGTTMELDVPTSDAVHLFADPITYETDRPYFYADCEGLSGGNKIPMATRAYQGVKNFRQRRRHAKNQTRTTAGYSGENGIAWAKPQQRSRQWMVENLYPRVLFTFSDVVCFVTKNFRWVPPCVFTTIYLHECAHLTLKQCPRICDCQVNSLG